MSEEAYKVKGLQKDLAPEVVSGTVTFRKLYREIAREFPIEPDSSDKEALEYLNNIKIAIEELREEEDDVNEDLITEFADGTVPYNNYKVANAFTQLGLYQSSDELDMAQSSEIAKEFPNDLLEIMRTVMFYKSDAVINYILNQDTLR